MGDVGMVNMARSGVRLANAGGVFVSESRGTEAYWVVIWVGGPAGALVLTMGGAPAGSCASAGWGICWGALTAEYWPGTCCTGMAMAWPGGNIVCPFCCTTYTGYGWDG